MHHAIARFAALTLLALPFRAVAQAADSPAEPGNPALPVASAAGLTFGARYRAPEPKPAPAAEGAPESGEPAEAAPAGDPGTGTGTAAPPPFPEGLLAEFRLSPAELGAFTRPGGVTGPLLILVPLDWNTPEAQALLAREPGPELEGFLRAVRGATRAGGAGVRFAIPPPPAGEAGAIFLKRISSAVRGEVRDARFGVWLPGAQPAAPLAGLYALELGPYLDLWLADGATLDEAGAAALGDAQTALDLTAELGVSGLPLKAQKSAAPLAAGLEHGFRLFVWDPLPATAKFVPGLRKFLPPGAIGVNRDGRGGAVLNGGPDDGAAIPGLVVAKLYDDRSDTEFVLFFAPEIPEKRVLRLTLPTADVAEARVIVPLHDAEFPLEIQARDTRGDTALALAYARGEPFLVAYKRFELRRIKGQPAETPGRRETVAVKAKYQIPIEELIKRYQAWQAGQDFRLDRWTAQAEVQYLFGLAGSAGTISISFDNNFFYDRKAGAAWEQTGMRVEGIEWNGRDIPELPIPQPEKVNTVPLDISFGKQYAYALVGEDRIGDRRAWKVRFKPLDPTRPLYDGHLWIDQQSYARLRVSAVQTNLKAPLLATDETTDYAPLPAEDGGEIWVMSRISGQQTFSAAGKTLKAQRLVKFKAVAVNPPDYQARLESASAGDNHMLIDTPEGLQYYAKGPDGARAPRKARTRRILAGAALYHDPSINFGGSTVAGGIAFDFLDSDFLHRDYQFNALVAGVFNNIAFANPHLGGTRTTFTASVSLSPLTFTDRFFVRGVERPLEQVGARQQTLYASLSHPAGNYVNLRAGAAFAPVNYSSLSIKDRDDDGAPDGTAADFVIPRNHLESTLFAEADFTRRGWGVALSASRVTRSKWTAWGTPAQQAEFDPGSKSQFKWDLAFSKEFPLAHYKRVTLAATWLDGRRLDRFSQYHFTIFGSKKLPGFAGSGVRFDQGWLTETGFGITAGDFMRVGLDLGFARVRTKDRAFNGTRIAGEPWTRHAGAALAANFLSVKKYIRFLPQNTLVRFEVGYAVESDYKEVEGNTTLTLGLLKLLR